MKQPGFYTLKLFENIFQALQINLKFPRNKPFREIKTFSSFMLTINWIWYLNSL